MKGIYDQRHKPEVVTGVLKEIQIGKKFTCAVRYKNEIAFAEAKTAEAAQSAAFDKAIRRYELMELRKGLRK